MLKNWMLIIVVLNIGALNCTGKGDSLDLCDSVLEVAEEMPQFENSNQGLLDYISDNIDLHKRMKKLDNVPPSTLIHIFFTINRQGKPVNITVEKGDSGKGDKELIKMISRMPAWKPGKHQGKLVCVKYTLPIRLHYSNPTMH